MTPVASSPTIACFGEILWDCLPRGLFLGGAPLNAAYHLARQGCRVLPVTAVGRDFLGGEAERRIAGWGVEGRWVQRRTDRPTGTVRASLDAEGAASYAIARSVAWDRIAVPAALRRGAPAPAAVVFGTLALRETPNRRTLDALLAAWPQAVRVVDLNLRAPFDGSGVIRFALARAQIVKLNDAELSRLTGARRRTPDALRSAARALARQAGISRVCVTAGARGAGLWWEGRWYWKNAHAITLRDTVGAGDAFLGGLLGALFVRQEPPEIALARACRLGEFVASRDGATPAYRLDADGRPQDGPAPQRRRRAPTPDAA